MTKKGYFFLVVGALLTTHCVPHRQDVNAAQIRLQLGWHYLAAGDLPAARRNILRAHANAKNDHRVYSALARLYQLEDDASAAEKAYQRAMQLAPSNEEVINQYAAFLCIMRKYENAQHLFAKTIASAHARTRADATELAGYCELQHEHYARAKQWLLKAYQLDRRKGKTMAAAAQQYEQQGNQGAAQVVRDIFER